MEMKSACEKCNKSLKVDGVAFICSYECTFCKECTEEFNKVCPNCQGELVARPKRQEKGDKK
jgi:hypothetical protein